MTSKRFYLWKCVSEPSLYYYYVVVTFVKSFKLIHLLSCSITVCLYAYCTLLLFCRCLFFFLSENCVTRVCLLFFLYYCYYHYYTLFYCFFFNVCRLFPLLLDLRSLTRNVWYCCYSYVFFRYHFCLLRSWWLTFVAYTTCSRHTSLTHITHRLTSVTQDLLVFIFVL